MYFVAVNRALNLNMAPRDRMEAPLVSGASGIRFGAAIRGLVFALYRPCGRRFRLLLLRPLRLALLSTESRLRRFVVFNLAFGDGSFTGRGGFVASVFSSGVGSSYVRRFRVCVFLFGCVVRRPLF